MCPVWVIGTHVNPSCIPFPFQVPLLSVHSQWLSISVMSECPTCQLLPSLGCKQNKPLHFWGSQNQPIRESLSHHSLLLKQGTNMADRRNTILEGSLKHRDGKKVSGHSRAFNQFSYLPNILKYKSMWFIFQWKPRWCIIRKLSPVAGECTFLIILSFSSYSLTVTVNSWKQQTCLDQHKQLQSAYLKIQ